MKKILIIDDDPDIGTVLQLLFKRQGYEVATAAHEEAAYRLVAEFEPNLILLDVLLSGTDGRTICKKLKADAATRSVPIIVFSAHPSVQKNREDCGADDFLAKPFQIPDLMNKIKHHLERKESRVRS